MNLRRLPMPRHLLLVTFMYGITRLHCPTNYQAKPHPWERTWDNHVEKRTLFSSTLVRHLCHLNPLLSLFWHLWIHPDVYQQPIAGMSPVELVKDMGCGRRDFPTLFLRCLFSVPSRSHCRAEVESIEGDLAETKRFLTTGDLAESYGSMSLTSGALSQSRKTCSRHKTFVALFSQVRMVHLIPATPQIQEQIVVGPR